MISTGICLVQGQRVCGPFAVSAGTVAEGGGLRGQSAWFLTPAPGQVIGRTQASARFSLSR